jgi:asparagine synthase (glutamine-hydrolysing)
MGIMPEELPGVLARMRDAQAHGGPDDAGLYINANGTVGLAHRRLSLLDLTSAGHQPMRTEDQSLWLSFNGEIYNFLTIREELTGYGYSFRTATDTEVILYAYHKWGVEAFGRFNGMFAFALYDDRRQQLFLVRDHSGIKPLYYTNHGGDLLFASEVRAFHPSGLAFVANPDWPLYFLSLGFVPEPYTTLQGVHMLPKASYLQWDVHKGKGEMQAYPKRTDHTPIVTEAGARTAVREGLTAAVGRHLIADAPIGVFLSGGIDSSILALVAGEALGDRLRTLSVSFREKNFDERAFQHVVAGKLTGRHASLTLDKPAFLEALPETLQALDQPSVDGINTWFITRYAKQQGLKAVLSGVGGDELFGGYPSFKRVHQLNAYRSLTRTIPNQVWGWLPPRLAKLSALGYGGDLGNYLFLRGLYPPRFVAQLVGCTEEEVISKLSSCLDGDHSRQPHPGQYASWLEQNYYMQQQLLKDTDAMSMWHGVEVRVPFLDDQLVNTVNRTRPGILFDRDKPKGLLIDSFSDILPEAVWNRPKKGFTLPFQEWLRETEYVKELSASRNPLIRSLSDQFNQGNLNWSRIWTLIVLQNRTPAPAAPAPAFCPTV